MSYKKLTNETRFQEIDALLSGGILTDEDESAVEEELDALIAAAVEKQLPEAPSAAENPEVELPDVPETLPGKDMFGKGGEKERMEEDKEEREGGGNGGGRKVCRDDGKERAREGVKKRKLNGLMSYLGSCNNKLKYCNYHLSDIFNFRCCDDY